jgi:hypothetical protein
MENYSWREDPEQFSAGQTVIYPEPTIEVSGSGDLSIYEPGHIRFRDGGLIRPVCPFLELWYTSPEDEKSGTTLRPLTIDVLLQNGGSLENITYEVVAVNRKAARRTHDESCSYRASLSVPASDFAKRPLLAFSPNTGSKPLVWERRPIPLGHFQPLQPISGLSEQRILHHVNLGTIRARFTPAKGEVYGPPSTTSAADPATERCHVIVPRANRITNPEAAWNFHDASAAETDASPQPTYDGESDLSRKQLSFGVVDDTCDVLVRVRLTWNGKSIQSTSRITCGPPDFAPDRRPFFSLADDFSDREPASYPLSPQTNQNNARTLSDEDYSTLQHYVFDLFRRINETAALINVDRYRLRALQINPSGTITKAVPGLPQTGDYTMRVRAEDDPGEDDKAFLSNESQTALRDTGNGDSVPHNNSNLLRHRIARDKHEDLADPQVLIDTILTNQNDLIPGIIRPPYQRFQQLKPYAGDPAKAGEARDVRVDRDTAWDMRMPPYMRDSDGCPLSLMRRQYELLLEYIELLRRFQQTPASAHRDWLLERRSKTRK